MLGMQGMPMGLLPALSITCYMSSQGDGWELLSWDPDLVVLSPASKPSVPVTCIQSKERHGTLNVQGPHCIWDKGLTHKICCDIVYLSSYSHLHAKLFSNSIPLSLLWSVWNILTVQYISWSVWYSLSAFFYHTDSYLLTLLFSVKLLFRKYSLKASLPPSAFILG